MEPLWNLEWRSYPAAGLMAFGFLMSLRGGLQMVRGFLLPLDRPAKNLRTVRAMRALLQGISFAAIAMGWWFHWPVAVAVGAIFGFEETIETSIATWALKQECELEHRASGRGPSG